MASRYLNSCSSWACSALLCQAVDARVTISFVSEFDFVSLHPCLISPVTPVVKHRNICILCTVK